MRVTLGQAAGVLCLPGYFVASLLIGWWTRPRARTSSNSFLNASASLPLPLVIGAFLAANCGALEVVGLSAMAAQYGALAFHFYWIGAIPAMVCLGLFVLPVYRRSGILSVPRFLGLRYGQRLELVNALAVAMLLLLLSGVSLYAMAQVLEVVLQMRFTYGVLLSASVVLAYVLLGGIRATLYTEVFQLLVMIAGLLPLSLRSLSLLQQSGVLRSSWAHVWQPVSLVHTKAPMDGVGLIFGLGLVLSFGYWCTDFVLMQRAFAARTEWGARSIPLWAGFGKIVFGFLVVLPGLLAGALHIVGRQVRYDQSLPWMMHRLYGPGMLGLGLTAICASLMSGLAANVSGFSAVWTEDLYRRYLKPGSSEAHYLLVGRGAAMAAVVIGVSCSAVSFYFSNLMEFVQLLFALLNAPFWAVFLLGVTTHRVRERAAVLGFLAGVLTGLVHAVAVGQGWVRYGSRMSGNFYSAALAFLVTVCVSLLLSKADGQRIGDRGAVASLSAPAGIQENRRSVWLWALAGVLLACLVVVNWIWW